MTWVSAQGIVLRDKVPATLRRQWVEQGHCLDLDLYRLYADRERAHPDRPAVVTESGSTTYAQLGRRARRLAGALRAQGLTCKDIIAIQLPNGLPALAADIAVAALGAVALPIPPGRDSREILGSLLRSRCAAAIVADPKVLEPIRAHLPDLRVVLTPETEAAEYATEPVDPESPARILVSSGTETEPKLVAYSHNAMAGGRGNYLAAVYAPTAPPRSLVLVPLSSSYGSLGLVTLVRHGGTLVLMDRFDPATALRAITRHRPSHLFVVPTMLRRMLAHPETDGTSRLQTVVSSGMPLNADAKEDCHRRFKCQVINVYGSADGVNCHTTLTGTLGKPDPAVAAIRIAEQGEICARGPMTPLCYVNAPELDARYRTHDGWTRTGDQGHFDAEGNLHLTGRLKQIVIRGGINISIAEAEQPLLAHPDVADAACVSVPDDDLGEKLCACVVLRPGIPPVSLAQLTRYLEVELGLDRRKLPEVLLLLSELPLGATGKVCRSTLTRLAAELAHSGAPETTPQTPGR